MRWEPQTAVNKLYLLHSSSLRLPELEFLMVFLTPPPPPPPPPLLMLLELAAPSPPPPRAFLKVHISEDMAPRRPPPLPRCFFDLRREEEENDVKCIPYLASKGSPLQVWWGKVHTVSHFEDYPASKGNQQFII